jgi:hypothetical protein
METFLQDISKLPGAMAEGMADETPRPKKIATEKKKKTTSGDEESPLDPFDL